MQKEVQVISIKEGFELGENISSKVLAFAFSLSAEIERQLLSQFSLACLFYEAYLLRSVIHWLAAN